MTSNQLEYNKQVEQHRANLAQEELTARNLTENERHNLATERHNVNVLGETKRHNLATENVAEQNIALGYSQLDYQYANLDEQSRHNLAQEEETHRTNTENERIKEDLGWANVDVATEANRIKSDYNDVSLILQRDTLNEQIRSNLAREEQIWEQNRIRERELQESIERRQEEMRIRQEQLEEQIRSNVTGEEIRRRANVNEAWRISETARHNKKTESAQTWQNVNGTIGSVGQVARAAVPLIMGGFF